MVASSLLICERCYVGSGALDWRLLDWRGRPRGVSLSFEQQTYRAMMIRRYVRVLESRENLDLTGADYIAASAYVLRELERHADPESDASGK